MAFIRKEGTQPQGQQRDQNQALAKRSEQGQLMRDPMQWMMRDPWQLMRDMMINPFGVFNQLGGFGDRDFTPSFELRETNDAFVLKGDMPGVKADDLEISIAGSDLQLTGKREQEQEQGESTWHTYERSYGQFTRTFQLPETADLDNIKCDLKEGVLSVVVPKKAGTAPYRRKIQIGSGSKS
jgi:HSP20 family protein